MCDGPSVVAPEVSTLSDPSRMPGRSMQLSLDGEPPPPVVRRVKLPVAPPPAGDADEVACARGESDGDSRLTAGAAARGVVVARGRSRRELELVGARGAGGVDAQDGVVVTADAGGEDDVSGDGGV